MSGYFEETLIKSKYKTVTLQDAATTTGNGTIQAIENYQNLTIGISGTSTSRTVEFHVVDENGIDDVIKGTRPKDFFQATSTSGNDETYQFDVTGYVSFYAKITAISGGNVTIKGRLVA